MIDSINLTDNEIVSMIKKGDDNKYGLIVDRYANKISSYVYNMVNFNKNLVEDLVQDIFLKVWTNIKKYEEGNFNAWIYRLAHNEVVNFIKKNNDSYYNDDYQVSYEPNDMDTLDKEFKTEILKNMINKIGGDYKEALILHYFDGKSYEDIATIMNKPISTIGTLISRGKSKLKEMIKTDNIK